MNLRYENYSCNQPLEVGGDYYRVPLTMKFDTTEATLVTIRWWVTYNQQLEPTFGGFRVALLAQVMPSVYGEIIWSDEQSYTQTTQNFVRLQQWVPALMSGVDQMPLYAGIRQRRESKQASVRASLLDVEFFGPVPSAKTGGN